MTPRTRWPAPWSSGWAGCQRDDNVPAKGEGNHSYPLERVEKAIAWLQAHGTHFVFPEGMMKNYSFVFQNVYKQITPTQTKYRPPYPGDRYFYSALSLSSAVPRGR